ncbi:MAG: acyltransferase family protein [Cyanobacteriota bacterium]
MATSPAVPAVPTVRLPPRPVEHLPMMDWLRGLASLAVVFFHLNVVKGDVNDAYTGLCQLGWLGVPVFFAISGWCMAGLSERSQGAGRFLLARLLRLHPPYLASVGVTLAALLIIKLTTGHNDITPLPSSPGAVLATLLLATKPVTAVKAINWSYWSLPVEFGFYVLTSLVLVLNQRRGRGPGQALLLLLLVLGLVLNLSGQRLIATPLFWLPWFPHFALGWIAQQWSQARWSLLPAGLTAMVALAGAAVGQNQSMEGGHYVGPEALMATFAALATVGLLLLGRRRLGQGLAAGPVGATLTHLGQISYSVYLLHVPIGCYLLLRLRRGPWLEQLPLHMAYDAMVVLVIVAASSLFHRWIEQPCHRWSRRIGRSPQAMAVVSGAPAAAEAVAAGR